jgi:hypothetical protein
MTALYGCLLRLGRETRAHGFKDGFFRGLNSSCELGLGQ